MDNPSKRKLNPSTTPEDTNQDTDKRRKVIGPSLPPLTEAANGSDNSDSDSDSSDDDFGPSLPPPEGSTPQQPQASAQATAQPPNTEEREEREKRAPKRDAWMLAPPTGGSDMSRVDPTKIRNRKFQSGPRVGNAPSGGGAVDSLWTETSEEKIRRLQDEAMGIVSSSSGGSGGAASSGADAKAAQAMREKVQRYNERVRKEGGSSLVEEKKRKEKEKGKEEEDDPSKRAFDKEKDMALSSKLTHAQKREMMSKAADFGSRFSKGKFL